MTCDVHLKQDHYSMLTSSYIIILHHRHYSSTIIQWVLSWTARMVVAATRGHADCHRSRSTRDQGVGHQPNIAEPSVSSVQRVSCRKTRQIIA